MSQSLSPEHSWLVGYPLPLLCHTIRANCNAGLGLRMAEVLHYVTGTGHLLSTGEHDLLLPERPFLSEAHMDVEAGILPGTLCAVKWKGDHCSSSAGV